MKVVINKEYSVVGQATLASELIKAVLETPKVGGVNVVEMKKAFRVIDKVETCGVDKSILLEDADAVYLKKEVMGFKWAVVDKGVVLFCSDIEEMSVYAPKKESQA